MHSRSTCEVCLKMVMLSVVKEITGSAPTGTVPPHAKRVGVSVARRDPSLVRASSCNTAWGPIAATPLIGTASFDEVARQDLAFKLIPKQRVVLTHCCSVSPIDSHQPVEARACQTSLTFNTDYATRMQVELCNFRRTHVLSCLAYQYGQDYNTHLWQALECVQTPPKVATQ